MTIAETFAEVADFTARASGRPIVFTIVAVSIAVWLLTGPVFGFSDAWQLIANTSTNVITFLMVFVIQNSQNRDTAASRNVPNLGPRVTIAHRRPRPFSRSCSIRQTPTTLSVRTSTVKKSVPASTAR